MGEATMEQAIEVASRKAFVILDGWGLDVLPPGWEAAMKVESRLFELVAVFFFVAAIIYVLLSHEPAGTPRCSSRADSV
jgi:hypothetical protein